MDNAGNLSGCDLVDSVENSSPEDAGRRSSSYDSVATGDDNEGHVSDASCPCDYAVFSNFFEDYTMRLSGAATEYFENMTPNDQAFFSSSFGFGDNYRPNLGVICGDHVFENVGNDHSNSRKHAQYPLVKDCNTPKRMACPKKKSCAKPLKRRCAKPKPKTAKRCAKPKPKRKCAKPKRIARKMCAKPKRKAKKMCRKPKRKPVCPRKPKCPKPYPGGQTSVFGMENNHSDASVKDSHIKENK